MNRIWIICVLVFGCSQNALTQVVFQPKQIEYNNKGVLYDFERAFDLKFYSNGFGFALNLGEIESYYKTSYFTIEFGTLKDYRERRQNKNVNLSGVGLSSSFIYGKQNSIYMFKFGQGKKQYLTEKAKRKGLAVGINYNYGLSLVIKKPYYIEVVNPEFTGPEDVLLTERYTEENEELFLDYNQIFGGTGFFEGFWSIRPTVGAHAKIGAHFAFGAFDKAVKAIEVGLQVDAFPRRLPIIVERDNIKNKYAYINMYIMAQFGKRR